MAKVEVKRSGKLVKAWVDSEELSFNANGLAAAKVPAGDHSFMWVVVGAPGDKYSIAIEKPKAAEFSHEGKLDSSKRDAGLHWFKA